MSKKKTFFGICLIIIALSSIFISLSPALHFNNKAGKVYKTIQTNFNFLEHENSPYVLLFFGYEGCGNICPPALSEISEIYKNLNQKQFKFYFVNLSKDSSQKRVDSFAKAFNKDFNSIYLKNSEVKNTINILKVKYLPSIINKVDIDHSGFLHILKKTKKSYTQEFLYTTRPFNLEYIINDLNNLKG